MSLGLRLYAAITTGILMLVLVSVLLWFFTNIEILDIFFLGILSYVFSIGAVLLATEKGR